MQISIKYRQIKLKENSMSQNTVATTDASWYSRLWETISPSNLITAGRNALIGGNPVEAFRQFGRQGLRTVERITERGFEVFERTSAYTGRTFERSLVRVLGSTNRYVDRATVVFSTTRDKVIVVANVVIVSGIGLSAFALNKLAKDYDFDSMFLTAAGVAGLSLGLSKAAYLLWNKEPNRELTVNRDPRALELMPAPAIVRIQNRIAPASAPDILLLQAAFRGDCALIKRLQKQGIHLEATDAMGRTALHWAVQGNQREALDLLWYYGCSLKTTDNNDHTPLALIDNSSPLYNHVLSLRRKANRFDHEIPLYHFYPPEVIVYKGGGAKGIAYVGVQYFLEENGLLRDLKRVAGTSAGAINALLVALGYTAAEMEQILRETDLKTFLDHPYQSEREFVQTVISIAKKKGDSTINDIFSACKQLYRLYCSEEIRSSLSEILEEVNERGGLCEGARILAWIEGLIRQKTGIANCTFGEYRALMESKGFKHLYVYASKMRPAKVACFSSENPECENIIIADAIRASMSIPILFMPHIMRTKADDGYIEEQPAIGSFLDGGIIKNLPIEFDYLKYRSTNTPSEKAWTNHQMLAFNLVDPPTEQPLVPEPSNRTSLLDSASATINFFASSEEHHLSLNPNHANRIVNISNCGIDLIGGFFADQADKNALLRSGRRGAQAFFEEAERLAQEHAEHDPKTFLSIYPQNAAQGNQNALQERQAHPVSLLPSSLPSAMERGIVEFPDEDRKEFDFDHETSVFARNMDEPMSEISQSSISDTIRTDQATETLEHRRITVIDPRNGLISIEEILRRNTAHSQQMAVLKKRLKNAQYPN